MKINGVAWSIGEGVLDVKGVCMYLGAFLRGLLSKKGVGSQSWLGLA